MSCLHFLLNGMIKYKMDLFELGRVIYVTCLQMSQLHWLHDFLGEFLCRMKNEKEWCHQFLEHKGAMRNNEPSMILICLPFVFMDECYICNFVTYVTNLLKCTLPARTFWGLLEQSLFMEYNEIEKVSSLPFGTPFWMKSTIEKGVNPTWYWFALPFVYGQVLYM